MRKQRLRSALLTSLVMCYALTLNTGLFGASQGDSLTGCFRACSTISVAVATPKGYRRDSVVNML